MDDSKNILEKAQDIYQILYQQYGEPEWRYPYPAIDELVSTILSQNTNDRNRDIAFEQLKTRFPTWEMVRDAPSEEVIEAVRTAGLANQKGPRIQKVLNQISEERGEISLDYMKTMESDEVMEKLLSYKGVGKKTASIVMQFSLGLPAFPVDTHIHRISGRLGLRPEKMTADQAHDHLAQLFDPDTYGPAHLNIIRLGREICHARKPDCASCLLQQHCKYYQNNKY
ncbi:MAG: endonuclease III [Anaerolineaceae bacterium]|nr:endonuclease III [Anaerolineaceae bacterium]